MVHCWRYDKFLDVVLCFDIGEEKDKTLESGEFVLLEDRDKEFVKDVHIVDLPEEGIVVFLCPDQELG